MTSRSEDLREAAFYLKSIGWPIFPLAPSGKTPVTENGVLDHERFTLEVTNAWWLAHPASNIGVATGIVFDVVDIDGPVGEEALRAALPGYVHEGPEVHTGRGRHLYFAKATLRNAANHEIKIDYRGHNGYVVAPPSIHPDGHRYEWANGPEAPLPTLPDEIRAAIGARKYEKVDLYERRTKDARSKTYDAIDCMALIDRWKGPCRWQRRGSTYTTVCPLGKHSDSDPSFTVYPDGHYFCFGCTTWGTASWIEGVELRDQR